MINYMLNIFISNKVLLSYLQNKNLTDIVIETLPFRNVSSHKNTVSPKKINLYNVFILSLKILSLFLKYLSKTNQKFKNIDYNFDFLIFVPNNKYIENFKTLSNGLKGSYRIISLSDLETIDFINIKKSIPKKLKLSISLELILLSVFLKSLTNKSDLLKLLNNIELVQKFTINILYFQEFFKHYKFNKFISLQPGIDHHNIIEIFFSEYFNRTYAIRPDATTYSEAHKHLITQNLFYKSNNEKEIYELCSLHKKMNLLKGTLLLDSSFFSNQHQLTQYPKNILLLDTCQTRFHHFNQARDLFNDDFYKLMKKFDVNTFHKFHPAQSIHEKEFISKTYNPIIVKSIDNYFLNEIDIVIGFDTTLFQKIILSHIPIIVIDRGYRINSNCINVENHDLELLPVKIVRDYENLLFILDTIFNKTTNNYKEFLNENDVYSKYRILYNYPDGLNYIYNELNRD